MAIINNNLRKMTMIETIMNRETNKKTIFNNKYPKILER